MYADNTLTPKEATRLCALGLLAECDLRYGALATELRQFITGILGPSLDVLGSSIELLKYERLVEAIDGKGLEDDAILSMTDRGRREMMTLLTAPVRAQSNDMNKLILALKFRFLHLLSTDEQLDQLDILAESSERELTRLTDLQARFGADPGHVTGWLGQEIIAVKARLEWLRQLENSIS